MTTGRGSVYMQKKVVQGALELTRECLSRYWKLDPELVISCCAEDVLWTGALQKQFIVGKEATAEDLRGTMRDLKPCYLMEQEFFVVQNTGTICTVAGRYLVTTDESVEFFLQVQQRCTFVWEQMPEGLKIRHMHISNPLGELKAAGDEMFPTTMGKMAHKYLMRRFATLQDKSRLVATDLDDREHIFLLSDILYAEARARYCDLTLKTGEIFPAKMSLTGFEKIADPYFVRVHRSYIVNIRYLSRIQPCEVMMRNKVRIPIPEKRFVEIREQIMKQFQGGEGEKNS